MKSEDLINLSIHIVTQFYKNDPGPFLENVSDDVLWVGPAQRQPIRGREELRRTFAEEQRAPALTAGGIRALCVSPDAHVREVLLQCDVQTRHPGGAAYTQRQRLQLTWRDRREPGGTAEIVMVHVSTAWPYDSRDGVCPGHYESAAAPDLLPSRQPSCVTLKLADGSIQRIDADRVLYIETVKYSSKVLVHTTDGAVTVGGTLKSFENQYPSHLTRIHAGYLVNPARVRQIRRFYVVLSDGTRLPVPEKKYTAIKKLLLG